MKLERGDAMKKVIAAKVEQILEFDSEQEADEFLEKMKKVKGFELLDYDNFTSDTNDDCYRIRIIKQYNNSPILESEWGLYP